MTRSIPTKRACCVLCGLLAAALGGCGGSNSARLTDGSTMGSGGVAGAGGTSASGGTTGTGGSATGGNATSDAGCAPGWTLCCGQCLSPSAGRCAPCPAAGGAGGAAGPGGATGGVDAAVGSTGGTGGTAGGGVRETGGATGSGGGTGIRDGGPVDAPKSGGGAGSGGTASGGGGANTGGLTSGGTGGAGAGGASTGGKGGASKGGTPTGGAAGTGTGGTSAGGVGGAGMGGTTTGGVGGTAACQQVGTLDQSCIVDSDCLAVRHTTNCCGTSVWLGINKTGAQEFSTLESVCDASYPACGCPSGPPTTSDGSSIPFAASAAVTCQGGVCKTYASACGHLCETGRSCITCGQADAGVSVCSLRCPSGTGCTEAAYSKCTSSFNGGVCVAPDLPCTGY
jgi:hypothetical protein